MSDFPPKDPQAMSHGHDGEISLPDVEVVKSQSALERLGLLGVDVRALSEADVRKAFRQRAKVYHPDAGGSDELMKLLNEAYREVLGMVANTQSSETLNRAENQKEKRETEKELRKDFADHLRGFKDAKSHMEHMLTFAEGISYQLRQGEISLSDLAELLDKVDDSALQTLTIMESDIPGWRSYDTTDAAELKKASVALRDAVQFIADMKGKNQKGGNDVFSSGGSRRETERLRDAYTAFERALGKVMAKGSTEAVPLYSTYLRPDQRAIVGEYIKGSIVWSPKE